MVRCVFHIDLDAFFVSVEQVLDPSLKGKLVIVGGDPERRGVVASASYEARPFGIHAGMPLSRARRLCPQAIFIQANLPRYREASAKFMGILADFSPHMEPLGLDEAYLDITGYEQPYGSAQKLALTIKERVHKELKLTASVGIATCKVVAKIASDLCKPDGLLEVAPGGEQDFLNPLPVAKLPGVGKKTEQALEGMGISTIGELASVPLDKMRKQFGAIGIVIHSYAMGMDERSVEAPGEPKSISKQITFAKDTLDHYSLEANLRWVCQEIGEELRCQNKRARCIAIRLRYADFETITRQLTLEEPLASNQLISITALQLLNKALAQKTKPARLIGVRVSNLVGEQRQLHMFNSRAGKLEQLNRAIELIRRKYGPTAIKTGKI